jgi:hypothetical protein
MFDVSDSQRALTVLFGHFSRFAGLEDRGCSIMAETCGSTIETGAQGSFAVGLGSAII